MRIVVYIIEVAIVIAIAVWLADRPGTVLLEWQGYRVETSVGILALAFFLFAVVIAGLYATWRWFRRRPYEWSMRRQLKRQEAGLKALSDGLVAIAAGDADTARKQARRAGGLLDHTPMTLLLEAQAAQISGDEAAARQSFEKMLKSPETEFLGLRGLIVDALRENDDARALSYAHRAYALKPRTPWVLDTMISLHSRAGDWREAQRLVEESQKSRRAKGGTGNRQQAALLTERARAARAGGQLADAFAQARKALEKSWARTPHPALMAAYLDVAVEGKSPLERYKAVESITRPVRTHPESRLALADAALDAKLWGEARAQLEALQTERPTARVFQLRARLAEDDAEDSTTADEWLERAAAADADPQWVCHDCGTVADEWSAVCGNCGAFGTLAWNQPPRIHRAVMVPPAATAVDEVAADPDTPPQVPARN